MRVTIRLGRVAGIPIGIHWSVLMITLLLMQGLAVSVLPAGAPGQATTAYWTAAAVASIMFMVGLLAHELAHALTARHYGVRVRRITLWLLGGVAELDGQAPHARGDLLIAVAGPLTSLAAAGAVAVAAVAASMVSAGALIVTALIWLAVVNAVLAVFNLLPGAPLDGGRVLAAVLWWLRGDRVAARRTAARAGTILGILLIGAGIAEILLLANLGGLWLAVLGGFLAAAAQAEASDALTSDRLTGIRVAEAMTAPAVCGYAEQTVAGFVAATARHRPHRTFPVLDHDGRLAGVVSLSRLSRVPPAARDTVRLGEVHLGLDRTTVLTPDTPLVVAAQSLTAGGHRLAPVALDGHVYGVLSVADIARAMELIALDTTPDRSGTPLPSSSPPPLVEDIRH
jgi:Zn-dependent protease